MASLYKKVLCLYHTDAASDTAVIYRHFKFHDIFSILRNSLLYSCTIKKFASVYTTGTNRFIIVFPRDPNCSTSRVRQNQFPFSCHIFLKLILIFAQIFRDFSSFQGFLLNFFYNSSSFPSVLHSPTI